MKRTYPTDDGGAIHEYTKHNNIKVKAEESADDETVIRVRLGNNVDFVRIENICISRKERD